MEWLAGTRGLRALDGRSSARSIKEFPGIRAIKVPDDDRLQERGFKVSQVHSMPSAGLGLDRLPMGDDAAGLAPKILQGAITPHVALGVPGMALDGNGAKRVVGPDGSGAPA